MGQLGQREVESYGAFEVSYQNDGRVSPFSTDHLLSQTSRTLSIDSWKMLTPLDLPDHDRNDVTASALILHNTTLGPDAPKSTHRQLMVDPSANIEFISIRTTPSTIRPQSRLLYTASPTCPLLPLTLVILLQAGSDRE